jgi:predicted NAD/FAD-binding protein
MNQRIAIVGGGVAGLTAGYLLHPTYDVTLFEKTGRLGGNAYTWTSRVGEEVDIAVAAFGKAGYPTFYRLLSRLGVKTSMCLSAYMSFHDLDRGTGIYLTPTLRGLFAQRFRVLGPRQVGILLRLLRGVRSGIRTRANGEFADLTFEAALERIPQLVGESRVALLCALCLLSSMSPAEVLAAPADFFFGKLAAHHDVVSPRAATSVRAVRKRTRSYLDALAAPLRERVVLDARLRRVARSDDGVTLTFDDGSTTAFDKVIFACPVDQALALLESPTDDERALLGAWRYKDGRVVVHRDHSGFPAWPLMQAYTFLYRDRAGAFETSVNGCLRYEPGVPKTCDLISSQHPNVPIRDELVELDTVLRTPIFDFASCATIPHLGRLNGVRRTYYCGSCFGYGLHEDAVRSAVQVAALLGVEF